jgi:hypothetical protein
MLVSCVQNKPKIDYNKTIDTNSLFKLDKQDTSKILVSELPIKIDSTDILLFAICLVDLQERGRNSSILPDSYSSTDIASSYFDRDNLIGTFINIVFQDEKGNERKLTDKKIKIKSVNFLRDIYNKTKVGYLLYSLMDGDSNGDGVINNSDIEALYISRIDGSSFKKITKELHEFYDWRLIKGENRIYFRTLEDKNKDGELTNKDKFHYYYIDFSGDSYTVNEYNPLKILE